jgi:hypothetical protein
VPFASRIEDGSIAGGVVTRYEGAMGVPRRGALHE